MNKRITWCAALAATVAAVMVAAPQGSVTRTGAPAPVLSQHVPFLPATVVSGEFSQKTPQSASMLADTQGDVVFTLHPTEEEFNKCTVVNANNDEYALEYYVVTGLNGKVYDWPIFYTNNGKCKNDADEWFITQAVSLDDIDNLYEMSVDVIGGAKYQTPESFQICIGKAPTVEAMTQVVINEPSVFHDEYQKISSTFGIKEAGTYYVGIHITSPVSAFRIAFRDITISRSNASAGAPLGVNNLTATPDPTGADKATVEFEMPQFTVNGKPIAATTTLTATIESAVETVTATGKPGDKISKEIKTNTGDNVIMVTVENADGKSPVEKITVRTSIDIPSDPVVTTNISADNMSVTLTWEQVTTGANGGIVIPEDITYNVYQYIEQETEQGNIAGWVPVAKDLTERKFTLACEDEVQTLYEFFVTAKNAAGETDGSLQCLGRARLGKLIDLPMKEDFSSMVVKYGGYMIESSDDDDESYDATWGFVTSDKIVSGSGSVGSLTGISQQSYSTKGMFALPKFASKGKNHLVAEFRVWIDGLLAPTTVYMDLSNGKRIKIGEFSTAGFTTAGWYDFQFAIPAEVENCDWANVGFDSSFPTYEFALMVCSFEIRELEKNDLAIESVKVEKAVINQPTEVTVTIHNRGSEDATVGKLTSAIYSRYYKVTDLELDGQGITLSSNESVTLKGVFTVVHSDFAGKTLSARVRIPDQDENPDNNFVNVDFRLYPSDEPVVSDLFGVVNKSGDGVSLMWTHPDDLPSVESFETQEHGDFSNTIGEWTNVDFDGKATWTVQETYFPNGVEAKAFQVIDCSQIDNENFTAHTGDFALFVWSAQEAQSDDWLISPEIDASEGFSFWSQIIDGTYTEVMEVLVSTTDREIDSFVLVDSIVQNKYGWTYNSIELPAGTKYVALHYCSNDQFGMVIDDIFYRPAHKAFDITGFNLYRNGEKIARLTTNSYDDIHAGFNSNIYHVSVLASKDGGPEMEYARSNEFTLGASAIDGSAVDSNISVTAGYGMLTVSGAEPGTAVKVFAADGKLVASETANATVNISLPAGVYMITVGEQVFKAAIR